MKKTKLDYLDICIAELNSRHQFYFDAADILDILNGVHVFYESTSGNDFVKYHFESDTRVVQALAFGGFLGQGIKLLPPHQVELADKIKNGLFRPISSQNYLALFWERDLKYYSRFVDILSSDSKVLVKETEEWVKKKGKDLLKAIFFSYKLTWQERLVEIFEKEYFKLMDYSVEDIEIHDQYDLFIELLDSFNNIEKRAGRSENNYRDVLSLMFLAKKVKQYNKDKDKRHPIPIYFDSQNFVSIIPSSILRDFFTIKTDSPLISSEPNYALRSPDYFTLYSLLAYNHNFPNEDKKYENFVSKQHVIEEIKRTLDYIQYSESIVGSRIILEQERKDAERRISNYIDYDFFNSILLKFISEKNDIISKVFSDIRIPPVREEVINQLKSHVQNILTNMNREINAITNWSANIFNELEKRVEILRNVVENIYEKGKDFDIFHDFSLFRFFIPKEYEIEIRLLYSSDGLFSRENRTYKAALVSVWNLIFRNFNHKTDSISLNEGDLFKLFSSFWILGLHNNIEKNNINSEDSNFLHHSLLMLKGACINRSITELKQENKSEDDLSNKYIEIINVLKNRIEVGMVKDNSYGEILVALAYLYFHLWLQKGNEPLLERAEEFSSRKKHSSTENLLAIQYAKEAFLFFDHKMSKESRHRVYALNIYIYYVIDSANDEKFEKITPLIDEFISLKPKTNIWNFRYDDTIARNFHRRSLLVNSNETKLKLANTSLKILEETLIKLEGLNGRDIREVESYKLRIQNYIGKIETLDRRL